MIEQVQISQEGKVRVIRAHNQGLAHVQCSSDQDLSLNTAPEQREKAPSNASHRFFPQHPDVRLHSCTPSELELITARGWGRGCSPCCLAQHLTSTSGGRAASSQPCSLPITSPAGLLKTTFSASHRLSMWKCIMQDSFPPTTYWLIFWKQSDWCNKYKREFTNYTEGFLSLYFKLSTCLCDGKFVKARIRQFTHTVGKYKLE